MDNHLDWTYDTKNFAGLGDVVKDLHDHGQHYVMIVVRKEARALCLVIMFPRVIFHFFIEMKIKSFEP